MPRQILISGCSYTQNANWPKLLWPHDQIINLGRGGAGNRYISESIIKSIHQTNPPDAVFALFSGINRSDVVVPKNTVTKKLAQDYKWYGEVDESLYFFSGGDKYRSLIVENYGRIKDDSWPCVSSLDDFFDLPPELIKESLEQGMLEFTEFNRKQLIHHALMINYLRNQNFLLNQTYHAIINLQICLDSIKIPYMFGWVYNPFDPDYHKMFGTIDIKNAWHKQVNWNKFLDIYPMDVALEYNLLCSDGVHSTPAGQKKWVDKIQGKVNKVFNCEKKHFFKNFLRRA